MQIVDALGGTGRHLNFFGTVDVHRAGIQSIAANLHPTEARRFPAAKVFRIEFDRDAVSSRIKIGEPIFTSVIRGCRARTIMILAYPWQTLMPEIPNDRVYYRISILIHHAPGDHAKRKHFNLKAVYSTGLYLDGLGQGDAGVHSIASSRHGD